MEGTQTYDLTDSCIPYTFLDSNLVLQSKSFKIVIPTNSAVRTLRNNIKMRMSITADIFIFIVEKNRAESNGQQDGNK